MYDAFTDDDRGSKEIHQQSKLIVTPEEYTPHYDAYITITAEIARDSDVVLQEQYLNGAIELNEVEYDRREDKTIVTAKLWGDNIKVDSRNEAALILFNTAMQNINGLNNMTLYSSNVTQSCLYVDVELAYPYRTEYIQDKWGDAASIEDALQSIANERNLDSIYDTECDTITASWRFAYGKEFPFTKDDLAKAIAAAPDLSKKVIAVAPANIKAKVSVERDL